MYTQLFVNFSVWLEYFSTAAFFTMLLIITINTCMQSLSIQDSTFRFALSKNGNIFSFGNLQEVEDSILTHHTSEVCVVHLKQTRNTIRKSILENWLKYNMTSISKRTFLHQVIKYQNTGTSFHNFIHFDVFCLPIYGTSVPLIF